MPEYLREQVGGLLKNKILWLFCLTIIVHGFLLLMDGMFWDDYLLADKIAYINPNKLLSFYDGAGGVLNLFAYLQWGVKALFGGHFIFGCRLITMVLLFLNSTLVFVISRRVSGYNEFDAFLLAALFLVYPAFKVASLIILWPYFFYLSLFLLAVYLLTKGGFISLDNATGWKHLFVLVLFSFSFLLNSLLVLYLGLLAVTAYNSLKGQNGLKSVLPGYLRKHWDYLLLPFLFFFIQKAFFPIHGFYKEVLGYNSLLILHYDGLMRVFSCFVVDFSHSLGLMCLVGNNIYFNLVALALFLAAGWRWVIKGTLPSLSFNDLRLFYWGILFLCLAIFPYAAVGSVVNSSQFFSYRHLIVASLPAAMIIFASIRIFSTVVGRPRFLSRGILLLFIAVFSVSIIYAYISIQLLWIKDRAIIATLAEKVSIRKYSTFYIKAPSDVHTHVWFEWGHIFKYAWDGRQWIGFGDDRWLEGKVTKNFYNDFFNLPDFDPRGPQAELTIDYPKYSLVQKIEILVRYYRGYFGLVSKMEYDRYLRSLVRIEVTPKKH